MTEDPERRMVEAYAPTSAAAAAMAALRALDDRLAETLRTTSEPMLGQIRLQWWHDALVALDTAPAPAEPVLAGVARHVLRGGVGGSMVAGMAEAWQALLQDELDDVALRTYGARGRRMFELIAALSGAAPGDPVTAAGEGWALADLSLRLSDAGEAAAARRIAETSLDQACGVRWSRNGRALGAMAHLARLELAGVPLGSPRRTGRALWHRMTGR